MPKVLHVGCGPKTIDKSGEFAGFDEVRLDIDQSVNPDVCCLVQDIPEQMHGQFDAVLSEHNIEHVPQHEVDLVLASMLKCLKPGGKLHLRCPDLESVFASALKNGLDAVLYESVSGPIKARDIIYGHEQSIKEGGLYMRHLTGFTSATLKAAVSQAGFSKPVVWRYPMRFELYITAVRGD